MARWQFRGRLDRQTDSRSVLATFELSAGSYGLNQLRYDLRKLKGYGLLERDGRRYAFQLTAKGIQVALLFLSFHNVCVALWPIAASTTNPIRPTVRTANWRPPITKPTRLSRISF